jgi:hypothetical protein
MHYPDFEKQFIVKADASLGSIGYILTQKFDKKKRVISYGSKKLSQLQQKWSTYDRFHKGTVKIFALLCAPLRPLLASCSVSRNQ